MTELVTTKNNENLKFWEEFQSTDPKYSKQASVSGQHRTTVDAQYKKKQITKAFGMYAKGWGIETNSETFERQNYESVSTIILHYRAVAFYVFEGERYTFPIAASIKEAYVTKNGQGYLKIDDEAVKKVRTDALTKGFTDLGFCSDVHMGMFDDDNYVTSQNAKMQVEAEEASAESLAKASELIAEWVKKEIESCKKLLPKNENGFKVSMRSVREKLITRCQATGIHPNKFTKRLDNIVLDELSKLEEGKNNAS